MNARGLVLQHGAWGPPGILADWASARGIALDIHRADHGEPLPRLNGQAFVASLGSPHNPNDLHVESVQAERLFIEEAVSRDTPVLGLCFGGQMLAAVLGGNVEHAPEPELGWYRVTSSDPGLVPPGPWLQWHFDRFSTPPEARLIATSPAGPQAFVSGRHLGVQFHPESTIEIASEWARADPERLLAHGIDGEARLEDGRANSGPAVEAAFQLFDGFWRRAHE